MRLRKWTSLGNWAERQKTISTLSARLRKNPDTQRQPEFAQRQNSRCKTRRLLLTLTGLRITSQVASATMQAEAEAAHKAMRDVVATAKLIKPQSAP